MGKKQFRTIVILILCALLLTIGTQAYWVVKSYSDSRLGLAVDLKLLLEEGLEIYYNFEAEKRIILNDTSLAYYSIIEKPYNPDTKGDSSQHLADKDENIFEVSDKLFRATKGMAGGFISMSDESRDVILSGFQPDSTDSKVEAYDKIFQTTLESLGENILELPILDSTFQQVLKANGIRVSYSIQYERNFDSHIELPENTVMAQFALFPKENRLLLKYSPFSTELFIRNLSVFAISLLVCLTIGAALAFLYRTVKQQKELVSIKNDLINNITHEFKTPIATVMTALEGMEHFNTENDEEKTKRYITHAKQQLTKLNGMVERVLETSLLDSDQLILNKELIDLDKIPQQLYERYALTAQAAQKELQLKLNKPAGVFADVFHLENALNNLIDNAIKYGGNRILLSVNNNQVSVSDNGGNLPSKERERVFEQFYRVPTGDLHAVKGFGIGLYYTKKIVEKHGGELQLQADSKHTTFKITLP